MVTDQHLSNHSALWLRHLMACVLAVAAAAFVFSTPSTAQAQDDEVVQIQSGFKATVGLGLVGAELGFAIPALAGLHKPWAFAVFPIVGAGIGATLGYFLIDKNENPRTSVAMLAIGIALIIPTFILVVAMTAYDPDDEPTVETTDGAQEIDEFGEPIENEATPADAQARNTQARDAKQKARIAAAGTGLFRVSEQGLLFGMPGVDVSPIYSDTERQQFGVNAGTEVKLSVFSGVF